jgi:hypothetical protein
VQPRHDEPRPLSPIHPAPTRSAVFLTCYTSPGGERGPVISPAFKAGDSVLSGSNGGFDSHTLPPYLTLSEPLALCMREHEGTLRTLHVPVGSNSRQLAVRFSQTFRYSPGVDVHRRADVRMTKQFLLDLDVRAMLVEQIRIRVPKCMPTESPNSDLSPARISQRR